MTACLRLLPPLCVLLQMDKATFRRTYVRVWRLMCSTRDGNEFGIYCVV